jgi:hypothetical protein
MEIKVLATPPTPLKVVTPEELAEGRNTVIVFLERPITLEIEGCIATYPVGQSAAPCVIANILFAQGAAERVGPDGCFIKRDVPKPAQTKYPSPFGGTMRWSI